AAAERIPLVPRGAGSAMGGGNVGDGVVVDLTRMDGPDLEVRPAERRARMRAGASLGELEVLATQHMLRLPPDPSSWRWATAGGVVSTNAAGARSLRYGSVRRWGESVTPVTADRDVAWFIPRRGRATATCHAPPAAPSPRRHPSPLPSPASSATRRLPSAGRASWFGCVFRAPPRTHGALRWLATSAPAL